MRFVDTKRFSPVIFGNDLPHKGDLFHHEITEIPVVKKERAKYISDNNVIIDTAWWDKQYQRCLYGYTVENAIERGGDAIEDEKDAFWKGNQCYLPQYDLFFFDNKVHISGRYYFFLNFWPIYGLIEEKDYKGIIRPRFLDHQFLFSRRMEMMREQKKDSHELKTRQLGVSEMVAGEEISYNYLFLPASVNIVVGGNSVDSDHTFENCVRGLDLMVNTQFWLERAKGGDNKSLIKSKLTKSEIRCLTAKDNPQTLSRFSPALVVYEEIGKGKKNWSLDVATYVKPSIRTLGQKTGYQIFIGTGGEVEEGAADLLERHYNPEKYDILSFENKFEEAIDIDSKRTGHFMPKWWFTSIDADGNTQKAEGIKLLKKERESIAKDKIYLHITQNALYASEALMVSSIGYFGAEKVNALNIRKIEIKQRPELQIERRGILTFKDNDSPNKGVNFEYADRGWLNIIEEPRLDAEGKVYVNLYNSGCDHYDQDEAYYSSSKGAMYVKKAYLEGDALVNTYVAEIFERPKTNEGGAELFFLHTVMTALWYRTKVNLEDSNQRIFDFYKNNGFKHLLFKRPRLAFAGKVLNSRLTNEYGTNKSLNPIGLSILSDRLTDDFIGNLYFSRQINALSKFKYTPGTAHPYNCDITIATMETEIMAKENEAILARSEKETISKSQRRCFKTINGNLMEVYL